MVCGGESHCGCTVSLTPWGEIPQTGEVPMLFPDKAYGWGDKTTYSRKLRYTLAKAQSNQDLDGATSPWSSSKWRVLLPIQNNMYLRMCSGIINSLLLSPVLLPALISLLLHRALK